LNNLFDLTGKVALVTGGKGLLAPIWKETLENAGAEVELFDLPHFDVTDKSLLSEKACEFNPDIIINNAAWDSPPTSKATFWGDFDGILNVNLFGVRNVCEAFLPNMVKRGSGVIVNIGSIQGYGGSDYRNYDLPFEKPISYNISKWALRGFAKSIAVQYGRYGIRCVTPSFSAYNGGKLKETFLKRFLHNVPLIKHGYEPLSLEQCISKKSLQQTLLYAVCCEDLTGQDWRVDGGLGAWA
jgi:NAD(P)-dependent dehydrogenase (short-subunit alcohol dehydrogenase family)